jgi:integrase
MSLFKRDGVWWVRLERPGYTRTRCTHEVSKRRAELFEREMVLRSYTAEGLASIREMSLGETINRYVDIVLLTKRRRPDEDIRKSARNDLLRLRRIEEFFGRGQRVSLVAKPRAVADFNYVLLQEMKPGSANRYLTILRAVLMKAYEWGALRVKPEIKLNSASGYRNYFLTEAEEERLIRACPESIRDFVIFLLDTGARRAEALDLPWRDVDLKRSPRPAVQFTDTKTDDIRIVPLPERAAEMLRRRRRAIPGAQPLVFMQRASKDIFKTAVGAGLYARAGDWIPLSNVQHLFARARIEAELRRCRIHDLRHTYASKLIRRGVPLLHVSRLLGHRTIDMTLRYSHLSPTGLDECVIVLDYPKDGRRGPRAKTFKESDAAEQSASSHQRKRR